MHNGRPHADEFKLDVDGFRFGTDTINHRM